MAGHKISEQDRTYWKTDPDDLKRHYIKALPYLSIDEAQVKDFESPEYRELKSTMSEKEDRISNLEEEVQLLKEVMNDSEYWKNKSQS